VEVLCGERVVVVEVVVVEVVVVWWWVAMMPYVVVVVAGVGDVGGARVGACNAHHLRCGVARCDPSESVSANPSSFHPAPPSAP